MLTHRALLRRNGHFRGRHSGERCFILCNGPSVLAQDLLPLRHETVMSVSSGYLHTDFQRIRPQYHLVPSITYGRMSEDDTVRWFTEMHDKLGDAQLFLASSEYPLVKRHSLFANRSVSYICQARPFFPYEKAIIDICGAVPKVASVPIMCLIVALYMGFRDMYLLGTDHDSFATRQYKYSFEPTVLRGKDFAVDTEGKIRVPLYEELKANLLLWQQYRHVKRIAAANGRNIYNATAGGMLDEFPRIALEDVLSVKTAPRPEACDS